MPYAGVIISAPSEMNRENSLLVFFTLFNFVAQSLEGKKREKIGEACQLGSFDSLVDTALDIKGA